MIVYRRHCGALVPLSEVQAASVFVLLVLVSQLYVFGPKNARYHRAPLALQEVAPQESKTDAKTCTGRALMF